MNAQTSSGSKQTLRQLTEPGQAAIPLLPDEWPTRNASATTIRFYWDGYKHKDGGLQSGTILRLLSYQSLLQRNKTPLALQFSFLFNKLAHDLRSSAHCAPHNGQQPLILVISGQITMI
jgi:hypothetical protein